MSTPDPSAVDWVPLYNLASAIPPVVNGQWLKGASGVPVWASITVGDVTVPRAKAIRFSTAQSLASGAWNQVQWDAEEYDSDNIFTPPSNRLTCKTAGVYAWACYLIVNMGAGSTFGNTFLALNIGKNSDAIGGGIGGAFVPWIGGIGPSITASGTITLAVNDFLAAHFYLNPGSASQLIAPSYFSMWRIA